MYIHVGDFDWILNVYSVYTLCVNFIISANCAVRRQYSFGHSNMCVNPVVIYMWIRKVIHVKNILDAYIEAHVYTITTGRPFTCVFMTLRNTVFVFSLLFPKDYNKTGIQTTYYYYYKKDGKKYCFSHLKI